MATKTVYKPLRGKVIAKILAEDRDRTYRKKIIRDDGTSTFLITTTNLYIKKTPVAGDTHVENHETLEELSESDEGRSKVFVRSAEVVAVGAGVSEFKVGDTILLDFKVDNTPGVVIGYEGEDKVVSLNAETAYFKEDIIIYASQKQPRDMAMCFKGEVQDVTSIIAIVRGKEIIANHPYVILKHIEIPLLQVNKNGILGFHSEEIITREVMGVCDFSSQEFGIKKGMNVMVKEADTFNILWDGQTFIAVNDSDILAEVK